MRQCANVPIFSGQWSVGRGISLRSRGNDNMIMNRNVGTRFIASDYNGGGATPLLGVFVG